MEVVDCREKLYKIEVLKAQKYYNKVEAKRKFCNVFSGVFSFLWVIFCGLWNAILCVFLGIGYCLTLIGIPLGIIYFKQIKLVFTPVNKKVNTRYGSHPIANTLWLLFGGLLTSLTMLIIGLVLKLTIIGIPFGRQYFKFAKFFFAPFGAKILRKYEFSSREKLCGVYTLLYLKRNDINVLEKEEYSDLRNQKWHFNSNVLDNKIHDFSKALKKSLIVYFFLSLIMVGITFLLIHFEFGNIEEFDVNSIVTKIPVIGIAIITLYMIFVLPFKIVKNNRRVRGIYYGYLSPSNYDFLEANVLLEKGMLILYSRLYQKYKNGVDSLILAEYPYSEIGV